MCVSLIQQQQCRDSNNQVILKYLQSDVANFGRGAAQQQLEQWAHDVVIHRRRFETIRFDLVKKVNEIEAKKVNKFVPVNATATTTVLGSQ